MKSLIVFIGIIVAFALVTYIWNTIQRLKGVPEADPEKYVRPDGCCGAHAVCEHPADELNSEPEYFDDEELDRFERRLSHEYSDEEADEFREIFQTLLDEEKTLWLRSLRMRHIGLPQQVKKEMLDVMKSLPKKHQLA